VRWSAIASPRKNGPAGAGNLDPSGNGAMSRTESGSVAGRVAAPRARGRPSAGQATAVRGEIALLTAGITLSAISSIERRASFWSIQSWPA
jgi:hypothetical protein